MSEKKKDLSQISNCCEPDNRLISSNKGEDLFDYGKPGDHHWIEGSIETHAGDIPIVSTKLCFKDKLGTWKVYWDIGRKYYRIKPGLYAAGCPTDESPVFVTANYKLSFDRLRSQLAGIDSWILILDTKGINVWCAAGKGTFGTDEIVRRVKLTGLENIISHRKLIVPQLGAPGVSAHKVKERCSFRIFYGPIRACDIPEYIRTRKVTPQMRRVTFGLFERSVLIPVDIVQGAKYFFMAAAGFLLLSGFGTGIYTLNNILSRGAVAALIVLITYLAGTILPPLLLPWLPGRAFSVKGAWGSLPLMAIFLLFALNNPGSFGNIPSVAAWLLIIPTLFSFITLNFTGNSTYTSLSGVEKEMTIAIPVQISTAFIGVCLWIIGPFV
jgi:acetyl-CoA decarbonylase/synthase complex subunit gamma